MINGPKIMESSSATNTFETQFEKKATFRQLRNFFKREKTIHFQ